MQQTATIQVTPSELSAYQRRPLDMEDYLNIVRRNVGWILAPLLAALTIAVVVACFYPNTYVSVAAIRVVPPQVPEKFVPTNVNVQMADRVQNMAQTILSRNTLTNIIQTYDLYRSERNRTTMEDIIENMRRDIMIGQPKSLPGNTRNAAFQISFSYDNRYVAQKVTRDLMTRFIDENIRERSSQSQLTTQFLREQWEESRRELDGIEMKLLQFRVANAGRLPEQMDRNLNQVTALESRIAAANASVSRANQDKLVLEGELRGARDKMAAIQKAIAEIAETRGPQAVMAESDPVLARMESELAQLQKALDQALQYYKPTYPDVQRLQSRIRAAQRERDEYLARKIIVPAGKPDSAPAAQRVNPQRSREYVELESNVQKIQGQIRGKELEIDRYMREIADCEQKMREVHGRIEVGPVGIQAYDLLQRDHSLAKARYDELNSKVSQSAIATDLENRKQGETLEVLDLPSLPESPTAPNRPIIITVGAVIGLIIGFALITVRELRDSSLKSLKDVRAYTQFAVLGSIPLLENDLVIRRRRRIGWLAWSTSILVSIAVMAFSTYHYLSTKL